MKKIYYGALLGAVFCLGLGLWAAAEEPGKSAEMINLYSENQKGDVRVPKVNKSDADWQTQLSPAQFQTLRQKQDETPYSGAYWNHHESGIYQCAACGADLFSSTTKFSTSCGRASFWQPIASTNVLIQGQDVLCSRCNSYLGKLLNDGPKPTGQHYCINSSALKFEKK